MNPLTELKKRFAPRSRGGAISLGPRREFSSLTWSEAEDRPQPQDGSLVNGSLVVDEPEVSPLPKNVASAAVNRKAQPAKKPSVAFLR